MLDWTRHCFLYLVALMMIGCMSCNADQHKNYTDPSHALAPPTPLRTHGRFIVDDDGHRVKLAAANWYGASDVTFVPHGLDHAHIDAIAQSIRALGLNAVRLPFSNEMLHISTPVAPEFVAANPQLVGLTPLEVYDATIDALSREGILIILNNHTTHGMWCCGFDKDGLWYTADTSEEDWINDWRFLAERYKDRRYVVGADLRNEVRTNLRLQIPHWADPEAEADADWHAAAERAGNAILEVNPDLLIVVEGVNFPRTHLQDVKQTPIVLQVANRLVYAAHNYAFTGPNLLNPPFYGDLNWPEFKATMDHDWGYVIQENQPYTAPVWVSEFGIGVEETNSEWFQNIIRYLKEGDFDFAYWPLNPGPKASGEEETFGLLELDWKTPRDDFRTQALQDIAAPSIGPGIDRPVAPK